MSVKIFENIGPENMTSLSSLDDISEAKTFNLWPRIAEIKCWLPIFVHAHRVG